MTANPIFSPYQSAVERKNFLNLNKTRKKAFSLNRWLVRDAKLREVLGITFLRTDNYTVAEEILVNKYCIKVKLRAAIRSAIAKESRHFSDE